METESWNALCPLHEPRVSASLFLNIKQICQIKKIVKVTNTTLMLFLQSSSTQLVFLTKIKEWVGTASFNYLWLTGTGSGKGKRKE